MDGLAGFLLAGIALTGSPGPATLSLTAAGAAFGTRRGLAYGAGITLGMLAVMALTASGIVAVVLALPGLAPVVTVLSALYFLYLAFRIATAPPLAGTNSDAAAPSFAAGFTLCWSIPRAMPRWPRCSPASRCCRSNRRLMQASRSASCCW